jgi:hypothetical protein
MVPFLLPFLLIVLILATTLPKDSRTKRGSTSKNSQSFLNHSHSTVSPYTTPTTSAAPTSTPISSTPILSTDCFPALDFQTPSILPNDTQGWWCDPTTEFAFVGFSYEVTACALIGLPPVQRLRTVSCRLPRSESIPAPKGLCRYAQYVPC